MEKVLNDVIDNFLGGRFKTCRSLLEGIPVAESKTSGVAQCLVENNLLVCSYKEELLSTDGEPDVSRAIDGFCAITSVMHGLPSSMKSLPVEFAASFNTSVLLLQRLNSRELPRSGSNRIYQAATDPAETGLNQIKEIARTCFHRVCSAMRVNEDRSAELQDLLIKITGFAHLLPADVISSVLLECCVASLAHVANHQHQDAIQILNQALKLQSRASRGDTQKVSSLVLLLSLQTGRLAVDVNALQDNGTSRVHAADLTQFLLVVCLFQTGQWEGCLAQINRDRSGLPEPLNLIRIFIQGFCLYQEGHVKSSIKKLMPLTAIRDCDVISKRVKVESLNLVGCCTATINKSYTARQIFQGALKVDFSYLCPLYNVSLIYRRLKLHDAELEALNILLKTLKDTKSSPDSDEGADDIISGCLATASLHTDGCFSFSQETLSVGFIMYTVARRSLDITRYSDAVQRYQELLNEEADSLLPNKSSTSRLQSSSGLPSVRKIYLEAALSLYYNNNIDKSISLLDKLLTKMGYKGKTKPEPQPSQTDRARRQLESPEDALPSTSNHSNSRHGDRDHNMLPSSSTTQNFKSSDGRISKSTLMSESEFPFRSPSVRFERIASRHSEEAEKTEKVNQKMYLANALLLKANCLIKKQELPDALRINNELLNHLAGVERKEEERVERHSKEDDRLETGKRTSTEAGNDSQKRKRRRIDSFLDNGSNPSPSEETKVRKLEPISSSLLEIKTKAYNNKALILIGQMKNPEAFQMLVLSLQCTPDDVDALYNYALLLTKMGRKQEACHTMKKLLEIETSLKTSPLSKYLFNT
ncbi:uncharacterized protein LOC117297063 isoform X2 [Asterias rubens]|uniref:uncharacterized protein LOC117297063 isoform X2 n=1 Tax=Asterias rubens TaxID=7604 RepID=UPI0014559E3F|nr:uncharacterized protein LOC117297063 isoform X2 [Asterias rubens]